MIFAKNTDKMFDLPLEETRHAPDKKVGAYVFLQTVQLSEAQAYDHYRKTLVAISAKAHLDKLKRIGQAPVTTNTLSGGLILKSSVSTANVSSLPDHANDADVFIIPKLYEYYPFLDCDNADMYNECVYLLEKDDVSWISYKSTPTKGSYWIFCDKPGSFDVTLDFIKNYPADPRYAWVAGYKKEFCVRALPRDNQTPVRHESRGSFSKGFEFWISDFDDYWKNGTIMEHIAMDLVGDKI